MATPTYTLISKQTLASAAASVTFSAIPQTYKHLVLETVGGITAGGPDTLLVQFNSDTATNYSGTYVIGNGSFAGSDRWSNGTGASVGRLASTVIASATSSIMAYASSSVFKTVLSDWRITTELVGSACSLWRSTSPITSMKIYSDNGRSLASGSTFRLWGVVG